MVFCLLLASCRAGVPEVVDTLPLRHASPEELVTIVNTRAHELHSIRALLQLEARGKYIPIRRSLNMSLAYVRPASVTLRAFDPLGRTLFDLTSNDTAYRIHVPSQNRVVTGTHAAVEADTTSDTPSMRHRMLSLVKAVSQTVLVTPIDDTQTVSVTEDSQLYRLDVMNDTHSTPAIRQVWFERINLDVVKAVIFDDSGNPLIHVDFDDYRGIGPSSGIQFPFHLAIQDLASQSRYTLKFTEVLPNPVLSPTHFSINE